MKAIWFLEEVLYLINTIFLKVNLLCTRGQEKARREEHPFTWPIHPDKSTYRSSPDFIQKQQKSDYMSTS